METSDLSQVVHVLAENRADEAISVRGDPHIQEIVQAVLLALGTNPARQPSGDAVTRNPTSPSTSSGAQSAFPN